MEGEKVELILYNSLTKQKEVFKPKVPGKVGMYVCGVTSYDFSHVGHARAYIAFDILYKFLKYLGYQVTYVRNFTDVDDKIINRAKEQDIAPIDLSATFSEEFLKDMTDLNCLPPTHQPRVSNHIQQIIEMITKIQNNDCAYSVEGNVYFSVDKSPNYRRLSGRRPEDNRPGERVEVDSRKQNPADFALWKSAKVGEPISWNSPWGLGRPGWHIECSAMSAAYLTPVFDIHGGGEDLKFPHHENEIAQSCAAFPESNVSYWMHNGLVTVNKAKMSKSGKFFTIREVTDLYHPLALRHFLLGTHYRSPVNYSKLQIDIASDAIYRMYQTLQECQDAFSSSEEGSVNTVAEPRGKTGHIKDAAQECIRQLQSDVMKISDDLDTISLLNSALPEALKFMNRSVTQLKKRQQRNEEHLVIQSLIELHKEVRDALGILGLLSNFKYSEVLEQLKSKALKRSGFGEDYVQGQIKERALARKNKEYSRGDQIRSDLAAKGIALMDVGTEIIWRPCVCVQQE